LRRAFLIVAVALPLSGCGWFGGHKSEDQPVATAGPTLSSDEVLRKDCSDDKWKQANLGLWYSVCRQSMKW
jgi:hypothetical protein